MEANTIQQPQKEPKRYRRFKGRVQRIFTQAINFILPPTCLVCDVRVQEKGLNSGVCSRCWVKLTPLGMHHQTAQMVLEKLAISNFYAPFLYNQTSATLVRHLKYADGVRVAPFMAKQMAQCLPEELPDVVVPVPLHKKRLYSRKYNQSAELVRYLVKIKPIEWDGQHLKRVRQTASQVGQGAEVRRRQLKNAFIATPSFFDGKYVLLVDDVCTTGSTAHACSQALYAAGARRVDLLTFAYVLPNV